LFFLTIIDPLLDLSVQSGAQFLQLSPEYLILFLDELVLLNEGLWLLPVEGVDFDVVEVVVDEALVLVLIIHSY
jgi:hypothetical protein